MTGREHELLVAVVADDPPVVRRHDAVSRHLVDVGDAPEVELDRIALAQVVDVAKSGAVRGPVPGDRDDLAGTGRRSDPIVARPLVEIGRGGPFHYNRVQP